MQMVQMVRKQVYIDAAQEQFLKRRATELGVTEAELIRQGIALLRTSPAGPGLDPDAWTDEEATLQARAQAQPTSTTTWRFRRDEIYEERLGRVSR